MFLYCKVNITEKNKFMNGKNIYKRKLIDFTTAEKNKLKSEFKSDYCSTKVKDKKNMLKLEIAENKFLRSISEIKIRENEEKRRERNKSRRGRK
jgi:hypothetical protein